MKIIQVNKFNYLRGGAEKYFLDISEKLRLSQHEVAIFSMQHPLNDSSPWSKYFISNIDFNKSNLWKKLFIPGRILYSLVAKRNFSRLIKDFKPDLIHCHNIYHQISPSILSAAKKYKIPTILHLHDYKLICPNYQLFTENAVCERCRGGKYYNCVEHRCLRNSFGRSLLAMLEMYLHHSILRIYKKNIDLFIAPSQFMKDVCVRFGWPAEKIVVLSNFYQAQKDRTISHSNEKNYLLYFGRLSPEKGIDVLIKAMAKTQGLLKIAGTGPMETELKELSKALGIEERVDFVGFQDGDSLQALINDSRAVVIPSVWPENMPFSLMESLASGKPVIASRIGGLSEIIIHEQNGMLFTPGDSEDLVTKIKDFDKLDYEKMATFARNHIVDSEIDQHLKKLLNIYQGVLGK